MPSAAHSKLQPFAATRRSTVDPPQLTLGRPFFADRSSRVLGPDTREAVKALLIANEFLEWVPERQSSRSYMRGLKRCSLHTYSD